MIKTKKRFDSQRHGIGIIIGVTLLACIVTTLALGKADSIVHSTGGGYVISIACVACLTGTITLVIGNTICDGFTLRSDELAKWTVIAAISSSILIGYLSGGIPVDDYDGLVLLVVLCSSFVIPLEAFGISAVHFNSFR